MRYIGSPGSVTYLHIELDGLSSINLILAGDPKIWLIIEPLDLKLLSKDLEWKMKDANVRFNLKTNPSCDRRAVHKPGFLYDPKELDALGVRYTIIYQEKGDLVLVGRDVPHQVFNLGSNVADAKLIQHLNLVTFKRLLFCKCRKALPVFMTSCKSLPCYVISKNSTREMGTQTDDKETEGVDMLIEEIITTEIEIQTAEKVTMEIGTQTDIKNINEIAIQTDERDNTEIALQTDERKIREIAVQTERNNSDFLVSMDFEYGGSWPLLLLSGVDIDVVQVIISKI